MQQLPKLYKISSYSKKQALNLLNSGTPLDSFDNTTYKFRKYCQYTLAFQDASF
eukprot:m.260134 g.260134  ORF g.260134 m.260134 type:complete len:54 (-) comp17589_c0_seq22:5662-5823(-)